MRALLRVGWNEPDVKRRMEILANCWADDGTYVDPGVSVSGRQSLCEHISSVRASRPGARIELRSTVDSHHAVLRFLWRLARADGSFGDTSIDFGEVDAEGKLSRVIGFFGELGPSA